MTDWLWLVVPVALVLGWWAGGRFAGKQSALPGGGLSAGYVAGLNFLLNEQPDRAIDVLVSMVEVDSETVETHLALGTLFRNQGEVDRAIRIHQNLIARPTLSKLQRSQAMMNLGLDYKLAGLNDRAVAVLEQLALEAGPYRDNALANLLDIYQYEKEWLKAIAVSRKLLKKDPLHQTQLIGHFYAELAELAIANGDLRGAAKILRQFRKLTPRSPRCLILQAKLSRIRGKKRTTLRWLNELIEHCPDYRIQVLDDLESCYPSAATDGQFLRRIKEIAGDSQSGAWLVCRIADKVAAREGAQAAMILLEQQSARLSAPMLTAKRLELTDLDIHLDATEEFINAVRALCDGLVADHAAYRCAQCGVKAKEPHWRCPGCETWESLEIQEVG